MRGGGRHDSEDGARRIVERDPFRRANLLSAHGLKAWAVE
jgi:hypothetical protein